MSAGHGQRKTRSQGPLARPGTNYHDDDDAAIERALSDLRQTYDKTKPVNLRREWRKVISAFRSRDQRQRKKRRDLQRQQRQDRRRARNQERDEPQGEDGSEEGGDDDQNHKEGGDEEEEEGEGMVVEEEESHTDSEPEDEPEPECLACWALKTIQTDILCACLRAEWDFEPGQSFYSRLTEGVSPSTMAQLVKNTTGRDDETLLLLFFGDAILTSRKLWDELHR